MKLLNFLLIVSLACSLSYCQTDTKSTIKFGILNDIVNYEKEYKKDGKTNKSTFTLDKHLLIRILGFNPKGDKVQIEFNAQSEIFSPDENDAPGIIIVKDTTYIKKELIRLIDSSITPDKYYSLALQTIYSYNIIYPIIEKLTYNEQNKIITIHYLSNDLFETTSIVSSYKIENDKLTLITTKN